MVTIHFHCMEKSSFNISQNIFFCVQQKKVSQTGSEWHENEQMTTTELFHFKSRNPTEDGIWTIHHCFLVFS